MYSIKDYFNFANEIYQSRGFSGVYNEGTSYLYESVLRQLGPIFGQDSEYVLDKEWDVLIILDACRVDLLEEVAEEYPFIETPPHDKIWSADSYSEGWLKKNFTGKQSVKHRKRMNNLVHVSGNPFTNSMFSDDQFQVLDEVWKYGWDDEDGYLPPDVVTDRAISLHREESPNQMLVHYMQPHAPFISDNATDYHIDINHFESPKGTVQQRTPWELLRDGEITHDELWSAYKDTLRVVLDSVETLLHSIDAERVVISADHGNAVGEWNIYGHPRNLPIPALREVPWVVTSANDNQEYTPDVHNKEVTEDIEEKLSALGYK